MLASDWSTKSSVDPLKEKSTFHMKFLNYNTISKFRYLYGMPIQLTVYNHPISYGTMGTVFMAILAAFASRIILQEVNKLILWIKWIEIYIYTIFYTVISDVSDTRKLDANRGFFFLPEPELNPKKWSYFWVKF